MASRRIGRRPPRRARSFAGCEQALNGALAGVIVVLLAVVAWLWSRDPGVPRAGEGELVVQSRPIGARVSVDGTERGVTPLTVRLPSGAHVLEVQIGKAEPRVIPLTIQANVQTAQYVELQGADSRPARSRFAVNPRARASRSMVSPVGPRRRRFATCRPAIMLVVLEVGSRKVITDRED